MLVPGTGVSLTCISALQMKMREVTASAPYDSFVSFAATWSFDSINLFSTPTQQAAPTVSGSKTT